MLYLTTNVAESVTNEVEKLSNMPLDKLTEYFISWVTSYGIKLIIGLLAIFIGLKVIKKVVKHFTKFLEKKSVDITLTKFLHAFVEISLKLLLFIIILGYWDVQLTGFAALIASGGVAIGLALQGSLSNFAGGFIILLIRPFKVGDYIETGIYQGTVEEIGLFYTKLTTIDNKLILIPNGTLSNGSLVNYSAKATRRVDLVFNVSYDNDINHVKNVLSDIVKTQDLILYNPAPFVGMVAHGPSSIDFAVRVWCDSKNYWTIHASLLEKVKIKFDEEGINIPYPQMDVHIKNN